MAWEVSALLLALSQHLTARFGVLTVRGELSGFSRASSGHCYFSLRDAQGADALVRCVMFRRVAAMLDFAPADGQRLELRGRLSLYESRGDLQFVVESMQRQGAGSLYEEFLRLRARLAAQGLFDESRKRPIPRHPRCVGVITSLGAAALHDVLTALSRRSAHVQVRVLPTLVQGAEAPAHIVRALQSAAEQSGIDTLLLVRGGGSLEDLWAFNDERVVRAIVASPLPVVVGVGHETDLTLADLAADLRAPTPTAAAELAAPRRDEALTALELLRQRLTVGLRRLLDRQAQRLDLLGHRAGRPGRVLLAEAQRLQGLQRRLPLALKASQRSQAPALQALAGRLQRAAALHPARARSALEPWAARLAAAHPDRVLERGYAWVAGPDGRPVMAARQLAPGTRIEAMFRDGRASAVVDAVELKSDDLRSPTMSRP